jgi:hypothetical protein
MSKHPLKFDWIPTGLDREHDFSGWDGDVRFGRIYKYHLGIWLWYLNGQKLGSANGQADTANEAAAEVERRYEKVKAMLIEDGRFDAVPRMPRETIAGMMLR